MAHHPGPPPTGLVVGDLVILFLHAPSRHSQYLCLAHPAGHGTEQSVAKRHPPRPTVPGHTSGTHSAGGWYPFITVPQFPRLYLATSAVHMVWDMPTYV